ncbi:Endonuclease/exonuclease/phosphatase [Cladochytrium replicatum]|nr:Endonuclease/exonuclease/phosphatase [Cladochytrium replicatum]
MRILSWNVNGIRTIRQYSPWNEHKNLKSILDTLDADIICFQETKVTRQRIEPDAAMVPGYDAFFSFSKSKQGYSGVATYVKYGITPVAAEEGFSGILSSAAGSQSIEDANNGAIGHYGNIHQEFTASELAALENEGRVVVTDHRLFVLFNIYFPNDASEERGEFKMKFNRAIEMRVTALQAVGRDVIIVGDVNVVHKEIDHCDPHKSIKDWGITSFDDLPSRKWFSNFLHPIGPMVDTFRHFHPTQTGAFTCWNTLINARPANYGARIDYVLATHNLVDWFEDGTVEQSVMGSDHCPVSATLRAIHPTTGRRLLEQLVPPDAIPEDPTDAEATVEVLKRRDPPVLCSKYWDEFSGKQRTLLGFVSKVETSKCTESTKDAIVAQSLPGGLGRSSSNLSKSSLNKQKRKGESAVGNGQVTLNHFFAKTSTSKRKDQTLSNQKEDLEEELSHMTDEELARYLSTEGGSFSSQAGSFTSHQSISTASSFAEDSNFVGENCDGSADDQNITVPAYPDPSISNSSQCSPSVSNHPPPPSNVRSWSDILKPPPPPMCYHNEPAKEYTVNKTGQNKGRRFYLCARMVGPSDPGGVEPPEPGANTRWKKKEVGQFRCDYFKWKNGGVVNGPKKREKPSEQGRLSGENSAKRPKR